MSSIVKNTGKLFVLTGTVGRRKRYHMQEAFGKRPTNLTCQSR